MIEVLSTIRPKNDHIHVFPRFMEPLNSGKYPAVMVDQVGKRLPKFSKRQSLLVKGSFDFIGLNYYTSYYAADIPCQTKNRTLLTDSCVNSTSKLHKMILNCLNTFSLNFLSWVCLNYTFLTYHSFFCIS